MGVPGFTVFSLTKRFNVSLCDDSTESAKTASASIFPLPGPVYYRKTSNTDITSLCLTLTNSGRFTILYKSEFGFTYNIISHWHQLSVLTKDLLFQRQACRAATLSWYGTPSLCCPRVLRVKAAYTTVVLTRHKE